MTDPAPLPPRLPPPAGVETVGLPSDSPSDAGDRVEAVDGRVGGARGEEAGPEEDAAAVAGGSEAVPSIRPDSGLDDAWAAVVSRRQLLGSDGPDAEVRGALLWHWGAGA